jgi:hypothetical protein
MLAKQKLDANISLSYYAALETGVVETKGELVGTVPHTYAFRGMFCLQWEERPESAERARIRFPPLRGQPVFYSFPFADNHIASIFKDSLITNTFLQCYRKSP